MRLSRRQFIAVTAGAAAGAAMPEAVMKWAAQVAVATADQPGFFLNATRMATCAAACARLVPTGSDPSTDPGATEAHAAIFIDRFLASFQELPSSVASNSPDNAAIWLQGPYSGRNPLPDGTGAVDDMLNSSGQMQLIPLNRIRRLTWKAQLYGADAVKGEPNVPAAWAQQVSDGTIPGVVPGGLRQLYANGLDAFDSWSKQITMQPFASASSNEQDLMLAVAGNVVVDGVGPNLPALPVAPPPAAESLFPTLLRDTFAACYGLPEYRGLHDNPLWELIGYDGDTQPLGNSIYDATLVGDNDGYGDGIYTLSGDYREHRPVSYPDPDSSVLTPAEIDQLMSMLAKKAQSQ